MSACRADDLLERNLIRLLGTSPAADPVAAALAALPAGAADAWFDPAGSGGRPDCRWSNARRMHWRTC